MSFYWFCLFVAANALLLLVLASYVSVVRRRYNIANGDGGEVALQRAIRAHANGVEYTPVFALLLLALSLQMAPEIWLGPLALGFTLGRVMHAMGMIGTIKWLRFWGTAVNHLWMAAAIVLLGWLLV